MKTGLRVEELWDIASKGCVETAYEEDEKTNVVALSLIRQSSGENILPKIEEATSIKEAWSILEKKYNEKRSFVHVAMHEHKEVEF